MAIVARAFQVVKSALGIQGKNPSQSVISQLKTVDGNPLNREVFHSPGVIGAPPAGERVILLQIGDAPEKAVVIAAHNYQITVVVGQGETLIYSTTADGKTLKAQIKLDVAGLIHVQNPSYNLLTILSNLISALTNWVSINCVNGSPVTPNPATVTALNNIVTQLQGLLA